MSNARYTLTAIRLHWLMALLIAGLFGVGLYMTGLKLSPQKLQIYSWHNWAGVTVFVLALVRLGWRMTHRPPPDDAGMPRSQQVAAHGVHHLLYLLMIAIPLSGWLMSSAKGFQTVWFGMLPLPDLLSKNKELGDLLQLIHMSLNYSMAALVLAHAAAAIKHHFVERDDVLARMLPFLNKNR